MIGLPPIQIWCSSVNPSLRTIGWLGSPWKWPGKFVESSITRPCIIDFAEIWHTGALWFCY